LFETGESVFFLYKLYIFSVQNVALHFVSSYGIVYLCSRDGIQLS